MKDDVVIVLIDASLFLHFAEWLAAPRHSCRGRKEPGAVSGPGSCTHFSSIRFPSRAT